MDVGKNPRVGGKIGESLGDNGVNGTHQSDKHLLYHHWEGTKLAKDPVRQPRYDQVLPHHVVL